jgi:plastocyanin
MRRFLAPLVIVGVLGALAAGAFAATAHVKVGDDYFNRAGTRPTISIHKGSSVTWVWRGNRRHNVTALSGPARFHSPTMRRGTYTKRFTRRGLYSIQCTLHPGMEMKVRVK